MTASTCEHDDLKQLSNASTVSVVIPTFNRADRLARALRSVYQQTRQADEVIVVDDGSTDKTRELLQWDFPQTTYFYQNQKGVSAARNLGIRRASGQWLAFLDSDDEWQPKKLEKQLLLANSTLEPYIIHSNEIWIRDGRRVNAGKKHTKSGGYIFEKCLLRCIISPSAVMIHRSVFLKAGLFDESLPACEDYDLWLRLCARWPVCYIDEPLIIKYGGHSDQLSKKYWGMDRFRVQALHKNLQAGTFSQTQYMAAQRILLDKLAILIKGAEKRGKWKEVESYRRLAARYNRSTITPDDSRELFFAS